MKNQNENAAVSDVTARMRTEASILAGVGYQRVTAETVSRKLREFADSIDAAVSKTETTTPGNAAALREALEKIVELTTPCEGVTSIELQVQGEAITALSSPPRNCDRFKSHGESMRAFENETNRGYSLYAEGTDSDWREYENWLFAKAKSEMKGEGDGK